MGWSIGYDKSWDRDIGYSVPCFCDHPKCSKHIHRGLAYVCGGKPYGGDNGCGLYFCSEHLWFRDMRNGESVENCWRCLHYKPPYKAKPEMRRWLRWKLKHDSWKEWREENPQEVLRYKEILNK